MGDTELAIWYSKFKLTLIVKRRCTPTPKNFQIFGVLDSWFYCLTVLDMSTKFSLEPLKKGYHT